MIDGSQLDTVQILRTVDLARRQERAARNNKLMMAAYWADHHPAESIDPSQLRMPGGDRPIHPGGDGTPSMAGFAVAEFAAELGKSIHATDRFIADALDLRHRLPRLWTRLCNHEIDGADAQYVARQTRQLTMVQAGLVDAAVADSVGRCAWAALVRLVEAKIIEVDAERIGRLAAEKAAETGVWVGRSTEHGTKTLFVRADAADVIWFDAMVDRFADLLARRGDNRPRDQRRSATIKILANPLYAVRLLAEDTAPTLFDPDLDLTDLVDLDDLDLADPDLDLEDADPAESSAGGPGHPDAGEDLGSAGDPAASSVFAPASGTAASGGSAASGTAASGGSAAELPVRFPCVDPDRRLAQAAIRAIGRLDPAKLRPDATLYVHIAAETCRSRLGVTRVEDIGPVVAGLVADWLHDCTITVKPVIDLPADLTPVDAYEVPKQMRERMFLRRPTSTFPYSASSGHHLDLDHSDPYRDGVPGQTRENNLGPLARREHNVITHGHWQRRQPEPGTHLFRAPHGRILLVNQTGTHDLGRGRHADQIWHATTPDTPTS